MNHSVSSKQPLKALIVTVVHHPDDARIRYRQLQSLLDAGWEVTYVAPFRAYDVAPHPVENLTLVDVPRAHGKRRRRAHVAAKHIIKKFAPEHDVVLIHDPELLAAVARVKHPNIIWDVHEDTAAAIEAKTWLPKPLRWFAEKTIRAAEKWADKRYGLLFAEYAYQDRFKNTHPVIPNAIRPVEKLGELSNNRVVYLGSITIERGAEMLRDVGRAMKEEFGDTIPLDVIGPAWDSQSEDIMKAAHEAGYLTWHGFLAQDQALPMLDGALAGLSLLQDLPNYRHSMPTKVLEYMGHGVPVITTPLPIPKELIDESQAGFVVPFTGTDEVIAALHTLVDDPDTRRAYSERGLYTIREQYDWNVVATRYIEALTPQY